MSDALPEDLWVNNFLSAAPKPLQTALQRRLEASTNHVNLLAEVYKQRSAIEAHYAESLAKLARQAEQGTLLSKASIDWEKGSGEAKIWESVVGEISETSTSHSTLAALMRTDFEQPLRELPSKIVAWRRISEQSASLDKALKDYEKTSAKLEKAASKSKSGKADQLSSELNSITSSLASLSPMVYTTYQRLDEDRLRSLKELVVRWATIKADLAQKEGERAERTVALLVSWENQEEVAAVGRRLGGASQGHIDRRASIATSTGDFAPRPVPRQNGSSNPTPSFAGGLKSMLGRKNTINPGRGRSESYAASTRSATTDREEIGEEAPRSAHSRPVDEEGYSVAPADRHRSPWDEPDETIPTPTIAPSPARATNFNQPFTSSPTASAEDLTQAPPKLNLAIAGSPIEESEEERAAALQRMQQTLQMQPPQQASRRQTVGRGRRDVRNTMFGMPEEGAQSNDLSRRASQSSVSSANPFDSSGLKAALPSAFTTTEGQGLRALLVETVNAKLKNGRAEKIQINGEIHLSLRTPTPARAPIHIRLSEFERLEKIAPNPAYLAQVPDKPGEYFLNAEVLSSATAGGSAKGVLLFKYQVHVAPGEETAALPFSLEPAFRCADGETRMILNYRSNSLPLSRTQIAVAFGPGPSVNNVQAKPAGGVWSPTSRRMTWSPEPGEGKIIAKFVTEPGEPLSPINAQASWSIEGYLCSGIGLSVVKGDLEADIELEDVQRMTTAGKYVAEPVVQ